MIALFSSSRVRTDALYFLHAFAKSRLLIGGLLAVCMCAYLVIAWLQFVSPEEAYGMNAKLRCGIRSDNGYGSIYPTNN